MEGKGTFSVSKLNRVCSTGENIKTPGTTLDSNLNQVSTWHLFPKSCQGYLHFWKVASSLGLCVRLMQCDFSNLVHIHKFEETAILISLGKCWRMCNQAPVLWIQKQNFNRCCFPTQRYINTTKMNRTYFWIDFISLNNLKCPFNDWINICHNPQEWSKVPKSLGHTLQATKWQWHRILN